MLFRRGIRLQAAAASCPHVRVLRVEQGASGMGANVVVNESIFCVFRKSAPPMVTAALPSLYDQDPDSRPALHTDAIDTHWNGSTSITTGTMRGRMERLGIRNMKGAHAAKGLQYQLVRTSRGRKPAPPFACGSNSTVSSLLREGSGGEGRRARALDRRRQGNPKQRRNSGVAPKRPRRGRRLWRQQLKKT